MKDNETMQIEKCLGLFLAESGKITDTEIVQLPEAYGRITAKDIVSQINVPSYPKSAMDGYAVRSEDIASAAKDKPVVLKVIGEILAGDYKELKYSKNAAVRIMTGGYIPDGFDCVVMQEHTNYGEDTVEIYTPVKVKTNYCEIGEDIKKGQIVVKQGKMLDAMDIGILASIGVYSIEAVRKLKTVIISTGTEIQFPYEKHESGKIYNNTAYILSSAINAAHLCCEEIAAVKDDEKQLEEAIERAVDKSDIIITTGAVSVGKKDIVPKVLLTMGAKHLFDHADIQPGTPTAGNVYKNCPILSLSGNPYAAIANFEIYFWDIAAKMMGCEDLHVKQEKAVLMSEYPKINKHRRLVRAYAENGKVYLPETNHASSVVSNMKSCNCLIDLEAGMAVKVGDEVRIRYIRIK